MTKRRGCIPEKLRVWMEAGKRHRLSPAHIQMAKELGLNPKKFGKLDNHRQEPWKAPLPIFIETLYFKRFGKERPDEIKSIKQIAAAQAAKKRAKRLRREQKRNLQSPVPADVTDFPDDFWLIEDAGDREIPF